MRNMLLISAGAIALACGATAANAETISNPGNSYPFFGPLCADGVGGGCQTQGLGETFTASTSGNLTNIQFTLNGSSLSSLYASFPGGGPGTVIGIGATSAVGSAILNNHPTAILNAIALESLPGAESRHVLAALVGGDLGPRFLPIGSLAGLLWLKQLRRAGVEIGLGQYVGRARATGKSFTARFAHVWTLQEGKIVRLQQCADTVQLARALDGPP